MGAAQRCSFSPFLSLRFDRIKKPELGRRIFTLARTEGTHQEKYSSTACVQKWYFSKHFSQSALSNWDRPTLYHQRTKITLHSILKDATLNSRERPKSAPYLRLNKTRKLLFPQLEATKALKKLKIEEKNFPNFLSKFFEVSGKSHSAEKCKRGDPLVLFEHSFSCKISKN